MKRRKVNWNYEEVNMENGISHLKYGKANWKDDVSIRLWDVSDRRH